MHQAFFFIPVVPFVSGFYLYFPVDCVFRFGLANLTICVFYMKDQLYMFYLLYTISIKVPRPSSSQRNLLESLAKNPDEMNHLFLFIIDFLLCWAKIHIFFPFMWWEIFLVFSQFCLSFILDHQIICFNYLYYNIISAALFFSFLILNELKMSKF